jgi:hypothetical protein
MRCEDDNKCRIVRDVHEDNRNLPYGNFLVFA